jgi:hypothetical protein
MSESMGHKTVIRGKFTALNMYIKKMKKIAINELNTQLKKLGEKHNK